MNENKRTDQAEGSGQPAVDGGDEDKLPSAGPQDEELVERRDALREAERQAAQRLAHSLARSLDGKQFR